MSSPMAIPDRRAMKALEEEPLLARLDTYVRPLSLIRAMGVGRGQLPTARLLASIMDDRTFAGASLLWSALIKHPKIAARFPGAGELVWRKLRARREREGIDLAIEASTTREQYVLAIENKVDAEGESEGARYQKLLATRYRGWQRLVVFLTPDGRPASSGEEGPTSVSVVSLSYLELARALRAAVRLLSGEREKRTIGEFLDHVEDEMGGADAAKDLVLKICAKHPKAVELLLRHAPTLRSQLDEYVAAVKSLSGASDLEVSTFSERGELKEIKIQRKAWLARKLPLTVMLHAHNIDDERPAVRLWVHEADLDFRQAELDEWIAAVHKRGGLSVGPVDLKFSPVADWDVWRRVLDEVDHPEDAFVAAAACHPAVVIKGAARAAELIEAVDESLK
jgi:hypothetical protein